MKKSIIAIPAILTLLGFGISTQTMAQDQNDVVVPIADDGSTAVGINDTLNDNALGNDKVEGEAAANDESIALNDNKFEDIANDKSSIVTNTNQTDNSVDADAANNLIGDYNATTTIGDAMVDNSITVKVNDVKVNTLSSQAQGQVNGNALSFGQGLEQESAGNYAEAKSESFNANLSFQNAETDQSNDSSQRVFQGQLQNTDQEIGQNQVNEEAALNASLQAERSEQDNEAVGVNVPVGVNVTDDDQTGTTTTADDTAIAETIQTQEDPTLQANLSDDPTNRATGENDSDQAADATTKSKQGDQGNIELAAEKSDQDQSQDAANKLKQGNKAKLANKADLANTTTQQPVADAGCYTSTQNQTVSLTTGDNDMSGFSMNGVNAIAQNSGVQSFNQVTQNVQLNQN